MRLDVFLKKACLIKTRTQAKEMCEMGRILLNGKKSKPSREMKQGDIILYNNENIRVLKIPIGNIKKNEAKEYYEIIKQGD